MLIRIGFDVSFQLYAPTPMLLMLYTHPTRGGSLLVPERIQTDPFMPISTFTDSFGNRCGRILAPPGRLRLWHEGLVRDTGLPDPVNPSAMQWSIDDLPPDAIQFLMGSRYCETDRLSEVAWSLFGQTPPGWQRVRAVCDWVHNHVQFGYEHARPTKTAYDVFQERKGVCRDFSHLFISMLRCLNIPARYVTGYLGDIGVPICPAPMDFSAWSEVFLDGQWYAFDARHNIPRIGRIVMARGRDAADVAITTSFGAATLSSFAVVTEEVNEHGNLSVSVVPPQSSGLATAV
ncbi:MAG: transglutaminase family protein [Tepidisphaeraceae bacterium]|jgi:transglutaminase-like putative cysteine protease